MAEFVFENGDSFIIAFQGSDLSLRATAVHSSGVRVSASTFFHGSGKNTAGYATPLQNKLLQAFAPLARGDAVVCQPQFSLARNFAVEVAAARPDNFVRLKTDETGNITMHIEGQDMGFCERVSVDIPAMVDAQHPNYPLFYVLHSFMQNSL